MDLERFAYHFCRHAGFHVLIIVYLFLRRFQFQLILLFNGIRCNNRLLFFLDASFRRSLSRRALRHSTLLLIALSSFVLDKFFSLLDPPPAILERLFRLQRRIQFFLRPRRRRQMRLPRQLRPLELQLRRRCRQIFIRRQFFLLDQSKRFFGAFDLVVRWDQFVAHRRLRVIRRAAHGAGLPFLQSACQQRRASEPRQFL